MAPRDPGVGGAATSRGGSTLVGNVLWNQAAFVFHAVLSFFVSPFVVKSLGDGAYGTWILLGSVVGYLGFLDFGIRGAVTRYVARHHAEGDHAEAGRFASSALVVFTITSVVAALAGVFLALFVIGRFSIPDELLRPARIAVLLSSLTLSASLLTGVFGGIVIARQRFDLSSGAAIATEGLRVLVLVLALLAGHGLVAVAAIQLGAGVLRLATSFFFSLRVYPELRPSFSGGSRLHLRHIFSFGLGSIGLAIAERVILQTDALVIGWFLPVSMVTYYAIAWNLTNYARQTVNAVAFTVVPRVSALEGVGSMDKARQFILLGSRVATLGLLPIVITFLFRGSTFIGLWMGPQYAEWSGGVLIIISLPLVFAAGRRVMTTALMGLSVHRFLLAPFAVEAVMNLTLSIMLVQDYGIMGVALGTAIPGVIINGAVLPVTFSRITKIPLTRFWYEAWIRPSLAVIPFGFATFAVERLTEPDALLIFMLQVAFLLPIAAVGGWLFGLDKMERDRLSGLFPWKKKVGD
jgi:O-antigen/teichoic acid export membrane protein